MRSLSRSNWKFPSLINSSVQLFDCAGCSHFLQPSIYREQRPRYSLHSLCSKSIQSIFPASHSTFATRNSRITMCRLLTVTCQRQTPYGDIISDHMLTFSDLKIACEQPGSGDCKAGVSKMKGFQNPPTQCAGERCVLRSLRLLPINHRVGQSVRR